MRSNALGKTKRKFLLYFTAESVDFAHFSNFLLEESDRQKHNWGMLYVSKIVLTYREKKIDCLRLKAENFQISYKVI